MSLSIAPKFSFKGKYTLSPAVEINANFKNTNYDHFSQKLERVNSSVNPEFRLGLAFNARKFYVGVAYHIDGTLGKDRGGRDGVQGEIFTSTSPRWYLQMGYNFQRREDSKFSFSPQIICGGYKFHHNYVQQDHSYIDIDMILNLTFRYKQIVWGISYEVEGLKAIVGWQKKNFRIAYTWIGI